MVSAGSRFIYFLKIFSLLAIVVVLLPSGQARAGIGTVLQDFRIADDVEGFTGPLFAGDEFGYSTAGIGDIDGDGFEDVAVGVPFSDDGRRPDCGGVWILFLEFGGSVRTARKLSDTEGGLSGLLNDFDLFGSSIAAAGDIDGDQIPDLLIGAPGDDDGGAETGSVYLAFLNADGSAREVRKFSNRSNTFLRLLEPGDRFGAAVVGPGDMDGDGIADLIVGAPGDDDGDGADAGAIWILFLDAEFEVRKIAKISNKFGELPTKLRSKIGFGSSLASLGRLDTDLIPEIVVGAPFDDTGSGSDVGALFVLWLNSDGTVRESSKISSADGGLGGGLGRGVNFGTSVTPIGDINGDRVVDLLVGAPKDDDGKGDDLGAAWVVMLSRDGTVVARQKISDEEGRLRARLSPGDRFGHGVAGTRRCQRRRSGGRSGGCAGGRRDRQECRRGLGGEPRRHSTSVRRCERDGDGTR